MAESSSSLPDCAARVLDAAMQVFSEQGYRASIDVVAQRAGVARQTIYNHFGSKEALFNAALERAVQGLFAGLDAVDGDYLAALFDFGLRFRARVLAPDAINLHRLLVGEANRFPVLANAMYEHCFVYGRSQIARLLSRAMADGVLQNDDPMEAASILLDLLINRDHDRLLFGGAAPDPAAEHDKVRRALQLFWRLYGGR